MAGYIKLFRQMTDWEWYQDVNVKCVFLHLLLCANYEDKRWRGKLIKRGQYVTSLEHLSEDLNLTIHQVRTALDKLEGTGEIVKQTTNKYSVITICKFDCYQSIDDAECQANGKQMANKWQTNVKQTANECQTNGKQTANECQTSGSQMATTKEYYKESKEGEEYTLSLSDTREEKFFARMKEPNTEWQVLACMKLGLTIESLLALITEFELECKARMLTHVSDADIRSHFVTWAKKELEKESYKQKKVKGYGRNKESVDKRGGFEPADNTDYSA